MLCPYAMMFFEEQLYVLKVYYDGINPIETFSVTKKEINLKNHHTRSCPIYALDTGLRGNISRIPKLEPQLFAGIYLGHSPFNAKLASLFLNIETGHV